MTHSVADSAQKSGRAGTVATVLLLLAVAIRDERQSTIRRPGGERFRLRSACELLAAPRYDVQYPKIPGGNDGIPGFVRCYCNFRFDPVDIRNPGYARDVNRPLTGPGGIKQVPDSAQENDGDNEGNYR